jgi:hypothetical protein
MFREHESLIASPLWVTNTNAAAHCLLTVAIGWPPTGDSRSFFVRGSSLLVGTALPDSLTGESGRSAET